MRQSNPMTDTQLEALADRMAANMPADQGDAVDYILAALKSVQQQALEGKEQPSTTSVDSADTGPYKPTDTPCPYCMAGMGMSCKVGYHWDGSMNPPRCQGDPTDAEMLNWMSRYSSLQIATTTDAGRQVKHIEGDGTALRVYGPTLRSAIRHGLALTESK